MKIYIAGISTVQSDTAEQLMVIGKAKPQHVLESYYYVSQAKVAVALPLTILSGRCCRHAALSIDASRSVHCHRAVVANVAFASSRLMGACA